MAENLVVIPAYNAALTLGEVLEEVHHFTEDLLVVDDGSTDETSKITKARKWVRTHQIEQNRGKGNALSAGLALGRKWGFSTAITMDADGQHNPREIPNFLEAYRKTQQHIIVGARFQDESEKKEHVPFLRLLANRVSSRLLSWRLGKRIPDGQSGYRLYDLEMVDLTKGLSPGFVWETQILVRAARRGYSLGSIPIQCRYPDGTKTSHYRSIRDSLEILRAIFAA